MPEGLYDSDVGLPSQGEAVTDSKGSRLPGLQDYNYSAADSSFCGDDISSEAGNLSSPIILSTSPSSDKQSSAISYITRGGEAVLSSFSRYVNRSQAKASMVAQNYNNSPLIANSMIETDASTWGWGATLKGSGPEKGGLW